MSVPTTPQDLLAAAKCFVCKLTPHEELAVQTYLLALVAGVDTSSAGVASLVANAKCFVTCIPPGEQLAVQNYLLTQLLS